MPFCTCIFGQCRTLSSVIFVQRCLFVDRHAVQFCHPREFLGTVLSFLTSLILLQVWHFCTILQNVFSVSALTMLCSTMYQCFQHRKFVSMLSVILMSHVVIFCNIFCWSYSLYYVLCFVCEVCVCVFVLCYILCCLYLLFCQSCSVKLGRCDLCFYIYFSVIFCYVHV